MSYHSAKKRFGYIAIKKRFITEDQFIEAMRTQISIEQKGDYPVLIGEIMKRMGFITDEQLEEVIKDTQESEGYKCPVCGMLFHECPNCGADLINFGM
jgi:rubrerythrin